MFSLKNNTYKLMLNQNKKKVQTMVHNDWARVCVKLLSQSKGFQGKQPTMLV